MPFIGRFQQFVRGRKRKKQYGLTVAYIYNKQRNDGVLDKAIPRTNKT